MFLRIFLFACLCFPAVACQAQGGPGGSTQVAPPPPASPQVPPGGGGFTPPPTAPGTPPPPVQPPPANNNICAISLECLSAIQGILCSQALLPEICDNLVERVLCAGNGLDLIGALQQIAGAGEIDLLEQLGILGQCT